MDMAFEQPTRFYFHLTNLAEGESYVRQDWQWKHFDLFSLPGRNMRSSYAQV